MTTTAASRQALGRYGESVAARLTRAQVFVLPQKALTKGATYRVNFAGTIDGTAFTRSFSFQPS